MGPQLRGIRTFFDNLVSPVSSIRQGATIIRKSGSRSKDHIRSQLREMLAKAADGSRSHDGNAVSTCMNTLAVLALY